ncbi:MAG: hypothetical protein PUD93_08895 [Lachnospiraceae bacterium]|nr:hypothetical protein [Lachnospiraceae bacterium]
MDIAGITNYTDYLVDANTDKTKELENQLNKAAGSDTEDKELLDACKQFEAYLWEQVFKGMEKTAKVFSDENEEEGYAENMVNYFQDSMMQEIAAQATNEGDGANSLAQMLYTQMKRNYNLD